uniref:Uncharacterized protein n=1 Tax=Rhizophora mucronata TaxID=61149 RepID=A0A2P2NKU7_RHIMU
MIKYTQQICSVSLFPQFSSNTHNHTQSSTHGRRSMVMGTSMILQHTNLYIAPIGVSILFNFSQVPRTQILESDQ